MYYMIMHSIFEATVQFSCSMVCICPKSVMPACFVQFDNKAFLCGNNMKQLHDMKYCSWSI